MEQMATLYVKDETGATFIPATQRPDGTWRKARRVKDGYVPQEEVPLYESKGKQWAKSQPGLPPGLSCGTQVPATSLVSIANCPQKQQVPEPPRAQEEVSLSKSAKKNIKRKKKKKSQGNSDAPAENDVTVNLSKLLINDKTMTDTPMNRNSCGQPVTTDPLKKLKNLRKKLREIDSLKNKIESGELENPDKDQLEKVSRRDQVVKEIEDLEFLVDE